MTKRKNRAQSAFLYWWNEFLFARYFDYETDLSPEELADNLRNVAHKRRGWLWGLYKTADVTMHPNQKGLDFDVQSKRRRTLDLIGIATARAQGSAVVDGGTGNTVVRGAVKFGRLFHFMLMLYLVYFAIFFPSVFLAEFGTARLADVPFMLIPLIILGAMMAFYWWRIYTDRNELAAQIEDAVFAEKAKRAADRLADQDVAPDSAEYDIAESPRREEGMRR